MPKLLRLKQPPNTREGPILGEWQNQLFDGLPLGPYARVGLRSLTVPFIQVLTVEPPSAPNATRISLALVAGGNPTSHVVIPPGKYKSADFRRLFARLFQATLDFGQVSARGLRALLTEGGGLFTFSFQAATVETTFTLPSALQNNVADAGGILRPTVAPAGDNTFAVEQGAFFMKGCAYLGGVLSGGSVAIGLIEDFSFDPAAPALPLTAMAYYIRTTVGGNYFIWSTALAAEVDTGIPSAANDLMRIEVSFGRVRYNVYRATNPLAGFPLVQGVLDLEIDYSVAVSFRDFAGRLALPLYIADQGDGLEVIPVIGGAGGRVRILSMGEQIASLLGNFPAQHRFPAGASGSLTGTEPPDFSGELGGVLVEIPSFGTLDAWDGATNRRRPIIASIPWIVTSRRSVLSYETGHPVMLELGNPTPLLLRNISIRILASIADSDQLATLSDPASAVLVFEDLSGQA